MIETTLKVLFIHYHYPPLRNSGIYRNYYLSNAILDKTGKGQLITSENPATISTEGLSLHPNLQRFPIFTLDYRTFSSHLGSKKNKGAAQFSESTKKYSIVQWFIKIQRSFPFNILLSEGSIIYIIMGYLKAKRIVKENQLTIVYSSFMPYADHIIAMFLKRKFPHLIWVADFRDLHVEPIYRNTIWPKFQYYIERRILSRADLLTTVSDGITNKMRLLHSNVMTLTKGVGSRVGRDKYDKFTIAYSGSLFLGFRDPGSIFEYIKMLIQNNLIDPDKFQFIYAGKDSVEMKKWIEQMDIESIFVDRGFVSHEEAKEIQDRSHINLLLTSASNEHTGLLTGKLFEYIEAGNLIICLINGNLDEEIERMFKRYNLGYVFYNSNDKTRQTEMIQNWYQEWLFSGRINFEMNTDLIRSEMSWEVQAKKFLDACEEVEKVRSLNEKKEY